MMAAQNPSYEITSAPVGIDLGKEPVTNAAFLNTVFFNALVLGLASNKAVRWVCHKATAEGKDWTGSVWDGHRNIEKPACNAYFSISALKPDALGGIHRRKENFDAMCCIVCDDVGTKVDPNRIQLAPTWKLETSPGNYQWGYVLSDPITNVSEADALMQAIIDAGYCDKGASGPTTRYMRLPIGINNKPEVISKNDGEAFRQRLAEWHPQRQFSKAMLIGRLGLKPHGVSETNVAIPESWVSSDSMPEWIRGIHSGEDYHNASMKISASLAALGTPAPAIIKTVRSLMEASDGARDARWAERYDDVPKLAKTALRKYAPVSGELGPLDVLSVGELMSLPQTSWLIKGLLPAGGMCVLFGASSVGKTFIALDLALTIAQGLPWRGRRVRRVGVVYLAAEAGAGITKRLQAFQKHHGVDLADVPFGVVPRSINLLAGDDYQLMIDACQKMSERGAPVGLIILDTLNRVMPGGNENASEDMGAVIDNAQTIATATGATVLIVHHAGKDMSAGARGHSSLRAAADTELEVKRDGDVRVLNVSKQRDGEDGLAYAYSLEVVRLGADEDLDPITSCVAVPADMSEADSQQPKLQGKWQKHVWAAITDLTLGDSPSKEVPTKIQKSAILARVEVIASEDCLSRWRESVGTAIMRMAKSGILAIEGNWVWKR
jgi:hypothetical protein